MTDQQSSVLKGALVVGGGLLLYKMFANDPDPYIDNAPHVTVDPSITQEQARILAEIIATAIYAGSTFWSGWPFGSLTEDEAAVVAAMTSEAITNDADVLLIADEYGIRGEFATPDLTLFQAIRRYLSTGDIEDINDAYRERGINIRI